MSKAYLCYPNKMNNHPITSLIAQYPKLLKKT